MRTFAAADLQRNPAEIQKAALTEPVFLTYHDKPRYVMMSLEEYVRIQGRRIVASPEAFPESVAARIREIADAFPNAEHEIAGGLASALEAEREAVARLKRSDLDKLVLATVNAPYKRNIDAVTLQDCLVEGKFGNWLVHVATFFTDVAPELVFGFAALHDISRSDLADAYFAMKAKTGEQNPDLEADFVSMAPSPR